MIQSSEDSVVAVLGVNVLVIRLQHFITPSASTYPSPFLIPVVMIQLNGGQWYDH